MATALIPKLNEENYPEWEMLMLALLTRKGLAEIVTGETTRPMGSPNAPAVKAYNRKAAEARAEIILNVEPSQLPHCRKPDVTEIWDDLKMIHQSRGFGTRMARRRQFFTMVKNEDQSMASWISDVRRAAFLLEEIGGRIDEEDTILVLTNGLPSEFDPFVINLDSTPADDLSLDYIVQRLLNEESRQLGSNVSLVNMVKTPKKGKKAPTPLDKITCFKCQQKGHYQSSCPLNHTPSAPPAQSTTAALILDNTDDDGYEF